MSKILIIEDEKLIGESIKVFMTKQGHEVELCENGSLAIKSLETSQYDRVICDLMLGDISGFDVLNELKRIHGADFVANNTVIMTAYASEKIIQQANLYKCPVLSKPFDDILKAIHIMLGEA